MLFVKNPPLHLLTCQTCLGTGVVALRTCATCHGMGVGMTDGGKFWYFGRPITKYHITLARYERFLNRFRLVGAVIFALGFWSVFLWVIYQKDEWIILGIPSYWMQKNVPAAALWLGVACFCYFFYRVIVDGKPLPTIPKTDEAHVEKKEVDFASFSDWATVQHLPRKKRQDISRFFSKDSYLAIEEAYRLGEFMGQDQIDPVDVFLGMLTLPKVRMVFVRLGIPLKMIEAKAAKLASRGKGGHDPILGAGVYEILFHAYHEALLHRQDQVDVTEFLAVTVRASEPIQDILYELGVDEQKLENVIEWVRIREKLRREYHKLRSAAAHHSKYGLDKAMTAVATPYLNNFSRDLTMMAAYDQLTTCVARDKELEEIFRVIEGGRQSVLLVGEHGVGKMSIIEGIAERMVEGDVPKRLDDKRLVQISTSALLAGTTVPGAQERLIHIMREVAHAGNIILFINNLHELMSVTNEQGEGMDVSETLAEYLGKGSFLTLATTTGDGFKRHIANSELGTAFAAVHVTEMGDNQSIQVLESKVGLVEYKQNVFFSYDAISTAVAFAKKFLHEQILPESAVSLMTEAASYAHAKKGDGSLVAAEDVAAVVSDKTGIPTTSISEGESDKLLRLEAAMHERVVGQDEAVSLVANALRRARAEVRSDKKPIANFLFLGPTGVGKTELAKTIAEVYFGGEDRMIRLDMSEYQDKSSVYRLIGEAGQQGTGLLTEAVRAQPFSLLLLDELEKADTNVLNVFLQVFDDGRLTDSTGRVIDFTNTIIIATSNAGTAYVGEQLKKGVSSDVIREALIRGELKQYYRPEFLNRFDAIVLFQSLEREAIKKICGLMLKRVARDLEKRGVELRVEDAALEALADVGFDPEFGARPMRRAIQDKVENQLASLILANKLKRKDVVVLGENATLTVRSV